MANGEARNCPVCDSQLDARAERCKYCDTDLSLFDFGGEDVRDTGELDLGDNGSIDRLLADIVEGAGGQGDILEEIKSLGREGGGDDTGAVEAPAEPGGVTFECPNCGESVAEDASTCPGCGVEFAEEAPQFECPVCNSAVEASASKCPSCGVDFAVPEEDAGATAEVPEIPPPGGDVADAAAEVDRALSFEDGEAVLVMDGEAAGGGSSVAAPSVPDVAVEELDLVAHLREERAKAREEEEWVTDDSRELVNELPQLVAEVKPMLVLAKNLDIEIRDTKDLINQAIAAGRQRNMLEAVRLVKRSKRQLKDFFTLQLAHRMEKLHMDIMAVKVNGGATEEAEGLLKGAITLLEGGHFEVAHSELAEARASFARQAGGHYEASEEFKAVRSLLSSAREFDIDLAEAANLLRKSAQALEKKEYDVSRLYAKQSKDRVLRELPVKLSLEMRSAREALMDMKVHGRDLSKPIGILKQASISLKKQEYGDALKYVKMFRNEVAEATTGS